MYPLGCSDRIDTVHALPLKIFKKAFEALFGFCQIGVVAQLRLQRDARNTRLIRINFPWVKVEDAGLLVAPRQAAAG